MRSLDAIIDDCRSRRLCVRCGQEGVCSLFEREGLCLRCAPMLLPTPGGGLAVQPPPGRRQMTAVDFAGSRTYVAGEALRAGEALWLDLADGKAYATEKGSDRALAAPDARVQPGGRVSMDALCLHRTCDSCGAPFTPTEARQTECSTKCYADIRGIDGPDY